MRVGGLVCDFTLPDHRGQPWRLSDHQGSPVVLIFHRHLR